MARAKSTNSPRLVEVAELPKAVRRGVYTDLVQEFANSKMTSAKIDGVKPSAITSAKKAVAALGLKNIKVVGIRGEVYLTKE
jgi:hypothetical protein